VKKSKILTELLRYFFSFLTILFFLFTQGSAIAQISVEEEGRTTEDFRPAEEQKTEPPGRLYEPGLRQDIKPGIGSKIFSASMELIKSYHVNTLSDRDLFRQTIDKLGLVLLPHCLENVEPSEDCAGSYETCFEEAIQAISERCKLDKDRLLLKALNIILRDLDPNSTLLDSSMINELKISTAGKFGGVGMVVTARNNGYVVIASFDGSPAQRAGIGAGDTILEIDGKPLQGLPLQEVLGMVRGPAGSMMSVVVKNSKTTAISSVRLRRKMIRIAPVRSLMFEEGIGYLRIVNFQENTGREVEKALLKMLDSSRYGLKGLILDLRDNPGGLFEEAIKVAGLFRPGSTITSLRGRNAQFNREFNAASRKTLPQIPIVVLINKGTASASEILAGALQGGSNVLVLGERSFGKASVQVVFPLSDGMALRLTTAHYYTADGRDIEGKGLEPDISIDSPEGLTLHKIGFSKPSELENDHEIKIALEYLLYDRLPSRSPFPTWY
jgi:carboxyl-terminal processing protease